MHSWTVVCNDPGAELNLQRIAKWGFHLYLPSSNSPVYRLNEDSQRKEASVSLGLFSSYAVICNLSAQVDIWPRLRLMMACISWVMNSETLAGHDIKVDPSCCL